MTTISCQAQPDLHTGGRECEHGSRYIDRAKTARPTFGKEVRPTTPGHQSFPIARGFEAAMSNRFPGASPKVRATLYLPQDLLEEARNAAVHLGGYPLRLTLTKFAERAFRAELQRLKETHNAGCNFPPRDEDLKGGRPIAA